MRAPDPTRAPDIYPVEVRVDRFGQPCEFLWLGRLWQVREIRRHWVDHDGPWWSSPAVRALVGSEASSQEALDDAASSAARRSVAVLERPEQLFAGATTEHRVWQVEASAPRRQSRPPLRPEESGRRVVELRLDHRTGCWTLR